MNPNPDRLPLGGYVAGNLTAEEERAVCRAALDNQEIFDELADSEELRHLLQSPRARRDLLETLDTLDRPASDRWFGWLRRPFGLALAGSVAAAAFVLALFWDKLFYSNAPLPPSIGMAEKTFAEQAAALGPRIFALPVTARPGDPGAPVLETNQTSYRTGDAFRIRFTCPTGSHALVVERRPDGSFVQHFPNAVQSELAIDGGEVFVPASGQGSAAAAGPEGTHSVRLVIYPANRTPAAGIGAAVAVVETQYTVAR